jgi:hypothetical protein
MLPGLKVKIGADTAEFDRGISRSQASITRFASIARNAALAAAAGITALTVASLRNVDAVAKQAASVGLSTRQLQRMSLVANEAGVATEQLTSMIGLMQRNIVELGRGTARQVETFNALGLSMQDLRGLSPERQFATIARALNGIQDPARRTAAAMDIFGRSGRAAINMLDDYADKLDDAAQFQERFGIAVSQTDSDTIERANDAMGRLGSILTGLGNVLAVRVAPYLERIANSFIFLADKALPDFRGEIGTATRAQYELNEAIGIFSDKQTPEALQAIKDKAEALRDMAQGALEAARGLLAAAQAEFDAEIAMGMMDPNKAMLDGFKMDQISNHITDSLNRIREAEEALQKAREGGGEFVLPVLEFESAEEAIGRASAALEEFGDRTVEVRGRFHDLRDSITNSMETALMGFVDSSKSMLDVFRNLAKEIISELYRIFVVKRITGFISNALGGFFNLNQVSGPTMPLGTGSIRPVPRSFEGGGFTGYGSRSGGIDGRGGMPAIVHPNETIVDHTRGQSTGSVVVNQTINVSTGVQQTVRTEIRQLMPQIAESAKQAVIDAKRRGGSYGRAFA